MVMVTHIVNVFHVTELYTYPRVKIVLCVFYYNEKNCLKAKKVSSGLSSVVGAAWRAPEV